MWFCVVGYSFSPVHTAPCQISIISCTLAGNLHSWFNIWLQLIGQRQLQQNTRIIWVLGFGAPYIREFMVIMQPQEMLSLSTLRSIPSQSWWFYQAEVTGPGTSMRKPDPLPDGRPAVKHAQGYDWLIYLWSDMTASLSDLYESWTCHFYKCLKIWFGVCSSDE